jgi:hypothetical protein
VRILILEDNEDRCIAMADRLGDRFGMYAVEFFITAGAMNDRIEAAPLDDVALICLDHDLERPPGADNTPVDPGTGVDVAKQLARHAPVCPVVLHTTNTHGGDTMRDALEAAGWMVLRVVPDGDLAWIDEKWFPAVRNAIVQELPGRASVVSNRTSESA